MTVAGSHENVPSEEDLGVRHQLEGDTLTVLRQAAASRRLPSMASDLAVYDVTGRNGRPRYRRGICILQIGVSVVLAFGPILRLSTESDMSSARRGRNRRPLGLRDCPAVVLDRAASAIGCR